MQTVTETETVNNLSNSQLWRRVTVLDVVEQRLHRDTSPPKYRCPCITSGSLVMTSYPVVAQIPIRSASLP